MSKILRCIDTVAAKYGGPSYSVINSSRILARRGHEVTIVTMDRPGDVQIEKEDGFRLICLGPGLPKYRLNPAYLVWLIRNLRDFDFVTVQGVWRFASYGFHLVNRVFKVPYVTMPHGSLDVWDRRSHRLKFFIKKIYWELFESRLYRHAARCYFTATAEQRQSTGAFGFSGIRHSIIAYGSVDPGVYRLTPLESDGKSIVYVGRIHEKKGIDILIDAFARVFGSDADARLVIAGNGESNFVKKLKERASNLGVDERIHWVGHIAGEEKQAILRSAGLFVLPSYQENFGLAVAEALSCGTPVAVSLHVNTCETIRAARAGYIFDNTVEEVSRVLNYWKESGYSEPECRARARACFEQSMSLERFVDDLISENGL
jgi:glycosyltransferase involved in cell wall biosynthesis